MNDFPFGALTLSLISLYDEMNDVDLMTSAWWFRLAASKQASIGSIINHQSDSNQFSYSSTNNHMLTCLEYAQHGYLLKALDFCLDYLSITNVQSGLTDLSTTSTATTTNTNNNNNNRSTNNTSNTIGSHSNLGHGLIGDPSTQFGELVNRSRLHEYCIRYFCYN